MTEESPDELEGVLLQLQSLIGSSVSLYREHLSQELVTGIGQDRKRFLVLADQLVHSAEQSIDILHALPPGCEEVRANGTWPSERHLICGAGEKVHVRLLITPQLLDDDFVREQLDKRRPASIRIARLPPLQALVVDGRVALVVTEPEAAGRQASVIRAAEVLRALSTLFESVWMGAVPAGERIVFGDRTRAELARHILSALRAGVTDEVAAREIGISVRTYRRYVAEIMNLLGASSRFQAGVRAAELGLLPTVRGWRAPGSSTERGRADPGG